MTSLLQLAPETLDQIASYLSPRDASSLSTTHSTLRSPGQRSLFAKVAFPEDSRGKSYLKFLLAVLTRPALGKYVTSLVVDTVDILEPDEFHEAYKKLDHVWQYLPALKHLSLTPTPFVPLTFEDCTNSLLSLDTRYCTESVHRLLLRNKALLRLSFTNDCRDINDNRHSCSFPRDALPHLRHIRADLGTYCALASTRSISHISHCSFPKLEQFIAAASTLAQTPGPLLKLNLFLTVGKDQSALLADWKFMAPLERHFATLTSLSIKFSMDKPEYEEVKAMCQSLPTALTSLRTLRLRLPAQHHIFIPPRVRNRDFGDECGLVLLAHKRCPSLQHISLFHRIDWHRVRSSSWIPLARQPNLRLSARKWYEQHPLHARLLAEHEHELEAAETDSLVSLPQHDNYEPDDEDGSEDALGSDDLEDLDWDALAQEVLELEHEQAALMPPPDSDIPQEIWQEMVNDPSHAEWTRQLISPLTGDSIAALLQQIDDAHLALCEYRTAADVAD